MALSEKEREIVQRALLAIGEERLRVEERMHDIMRQVITLRSVAVKLDLSFDELARLITPSTDAVRGKMKEIADEVKP
jgi:signal transduction histidine kinase